MSIIQNHFKQYGRWETFDDTDGLGHMAYCMFQDLADRRGPERQHLGRDDLRHVLADLSQAAAAARPRTGGK